MKVYPVNAIEAANLSSSQTASYDDLQNLSNRYIEFQVDFTKKDIKITGNWNRLIEFDAFIIGNTNAETGKLTVFNNNETVFKKEFEIDEYIKIISNTDDFNEEITKEINKFELELSGSENLKIGYLFIGRTWLLPRFVVAPGRQLQIRNDAGRTFSGQVSGIPKQTLKTFGCQFARIETKDTKIIDDYVNGCQSVIPHVIDPYYGAHEDFEPMFATIEEYGEQEKRDENGFYWNFSMAWQEAR